MNSLVASAYRPKTAAVRDERLLLALTEKEQRMFLPGIDLGTTFAVPCQQADLQDRDAGRWERLLREYRPTVLISAWDTPPLPASWLTGPDLSLRYICQVTGAVRFLFPRSLLLRGVKVTNWGDLASVPVAEHALLLALAALRNLAGWQSAIRNARLPGSTVTRNNLGTRSLHGRRVGIHGFGHVARSLMKLLQPFGTSVHVYSEGVPTSLILNAGATPCANLVDLFARSEVLFECESLTPFTTGSVDAAVLAALPDQAIFVNVARGALVDEQALLREAQSGRIRIALDVVVNDPIGPDDPLLNASDGVFSPHIAGPTQDCFPGCGRHALDNLRRYLDDEPLMSVITPEIYDRST
ncbi:MAG: NAD(P)-dependent oxidoreductase [Opitutaceae bacterium]|jgi:phosphoglycerate dehydrogenase-like enzyme